jgi:hypothetical protein
MDLAVPLGTLRPEGSCPLINEQISLKSKGKRKGKRKSKSKSKSKSKNKSKGKGKRKSKGKSKSKGKRDVNFSLLLINQWCYKLL